MKKLFAVLLINTLPLLPMQKQSPTTQYEKKLDTYLKQQTEFGNFSGTVLVAKKGKIILSKAFGMANYELGVPNATHMKFRIGSLSKQFTAVALMQLQEKGLLSLSDTLAKYIPEYSGAYTVTLHQILTHTAGIPNITLFEDFKVACLQPTTLEKSIKYILQKPLEFTPGDHYAYSNSGYIILSYIIEKVSGISFEKYLKENIFAPLQMRDTGLDSNALVLKNRVSGYSRDEQGLKNASFLDMSWAAGSGGLYSTSLDLFKWNQAWFSEKIVSKESWKKVLSLQVPLKKEECNLGYGYGFTICTESGIASISHVGNINGFSSKIIMYLEQEITIIVLSNFAFTPLAKISQALEHIMLDKPYQMPRKYVEIKISADTLNNYSGKYSTKDGQHFTITVEDGYLLFGYKNQSLKMYPCSETEFFSKIKDAQLIFKKDSQGKVNGLIYSVDLESQEAKKDADPKE